MLAILILHLNTHVINIVMLTRWKAAYKITIKEIALTRTDASTIRGFHCIFNLLIVVMSRIIEMGLKHTLSDIKL